VLGTFNKRIKCCGKLKENGNCNIPTLGGKINSFGEYFNDLKM